MRKLLLASAVMMLVGCGPSSTPFTRALSALKGGDYTAFQAAKAEVDAETRTAIQPDGDLMFDAGALSPTATAVGLAFTSRIWKPWKATPRG